MKIEFVKDRPGHDERYAINPSKIKKELGWESKHSFIEGLKKTINWYMHNLDWFENISSGNSYNFERLGEKK